MMPVGFRYAIGVEYCGSEFHGWQSQRNAQPTIQGVLEEAIGFVVNEKVELKVAGRTDKGVHALGQVAHFESSAKRSEHQLIAGSNGLLPPAVRIRWVRRVPFDFHARFSAKSRTYRYIVCNDVVEPALMRWGVAWWKRPVNTEDMHSAAQYWLGERDFSAFQASGCSARSPRRRVNSIGVARSNQYVKVDITANAFLLHMVRNMVGSLRMIGEGRCSVDWAARLIDSRDRRQAGPTAEAGGLYLMKVEYDEVFDIPDSNRTMPPFDR